MQNPNQPQRVPEPREAGFIAILLSSIITFETARWVSMTVEKILLANGFDDFPNIAGLLSVVAVIAQWALVAQFIQFFIDEYILIPFYQDKAIRDMKRLQRRFEDKGSSKMRYGWGIVILAALYIFLGR